MFQLANHTFVYWDTPTPPVLPAEIIAVSARAGVDNIDGQATGIRGEQFVAGMVSWWPTYTQGLAKIAEYQLLRGQDPKLLIYNGVNFQAAYGVLFLVVSVRARSCQRHPRLMGNGLDYIGGTELVTDFTLQAITV